ncbi:MAG: hypothetical protein HYX75_22100 [Acidobacteria bacterium]|nr:hypothetical protein [Acidobacteriota bacterium]
MGARYKPESTPEPGGGRGPREGGSALTAAVFAALVLGLCPLFLIGFYHDDYGLIRATFDRHWWQVFDPRYIEVNYHYNPMRLLLFSALTRIAGPAPWAFHLTSLLMQTASFTAWYLISGRFCRSWVVRVCLAGVVCFLPLVSEAVLSIGANDQVIGTAAYLWALWGFLRFIEGGDRRSLVLSLVVYVLGLLANEMLITLPVVMLLVQLFPHAWDIRSGRRSWGCLWPFGIFTALYLVIHTAAADPDALREQGYALSPGLHNLGNLVFAGKVALLAPTLLHRAGAESFWGVLTDLEQAPFLTFVSAVLVLGLLVARRTRVLAIWLCLTLLPYTLRTGYPQGARYYHLPTAIVLLAATALIGSCVHRWSWCRWPAFGVSLLWFWSCYSVWIKGDVSFYRGMCDEGDAVVRRVLQQVPGEMDPNDVVVVFNDAPFAVRYVLGGAVELPLRSRAHPPAGVVHFFDLDRYWESTVETIPGDWEWDISLSLTLITTDPYEDPHELDARIPFTRPAFRSDTEIHWNVKPPFPGWLVWRFKEPIDAADPVCTVRATLEEYPPDRGSSVAERVSTWDLTLPAGRIRLPRPLHNHSWGRLRVAGTDASCLEFELLRLEAM